MREPYDFDEQLRMGHEHELALDAYFSQIWQVDLVPMEDQYKGIDRLYKWQDGRTMTVEYKADEASARTGNFFIEIMSQVEHERLGWGYISRSQVLIIYSPDRGVAWSASMLEVRKLVKSWEERFPLRDVPNKSWTTRGVCVPIEVFEREVKSHLRHQIREQEAA